jgi:hypothetical protein
VESVSSCKDALSPIFPYDFLVVVITITIVDPDWARLFESGLVMCRSRRGSVCREYRILYQSDSPVPRLRKRRKELLFCVSGVHSIFAQSGDSAINIEGA